MPENNFHFFVDNKSAGVHYWQIVQQNKQPRNPVKVMDSVDALDLMDLALKILRDGRLTFKFVVKDGEPAFELFREGKWMPVDPTFLDRIREQRLRHRRALRSVIGQESL